jgi:hypothetical protein
MTGDEIDAAFRVIGTLQPQVPGCADTPRASQLAEGAAWRLVSRRMR